MYGNEVEFNSLVGLTLNEISGAAGDEEMVFTTTSGERFRMYHEQDCCESVLVDDICGDLGDLIGSPITLAEEVSNKDEHPPGVPELEYADDSWTWTFYRLATQKGFVTIRWYGSSNGYYSESVSFVRA